VSTARYLGTTGRHLAMVSRVDRLRAVLDPRALFPRQGALNLFDNRIVLTGWEQHASVTVHARELATIDTADLSSTRLRPIALHHTNGEILYLVINHRRLTNRDDNAEWVVLLADWLNQP
jgi:hypothetical protein